MTGIKRPGFRNGDKESVNFTTDFRPPIQGENLNPRLKRDDFRSIGPFNYQYPEFDRLKRIEIETKGQVVRLGAETLKKLFEVETLDAFGRKKKVMLNLGEILQTVPTTLNLLRGLLNRNDTIDIQTKALLLTNLARFIGVDSTLITTAGVSVFDRISNIVVGPSVGVIIANQDLMRSVRPLVIAGSFGLPTALFGVVNLNLNLADVTFDRMLMRLFLFLLIQINISVADFTIIVRQIVLFNQSYDFRTFQLTGAPAAVGNIGRIPFQPGGPVVAPRPPGAPAIPAVVAGVAPPVVRPVAARGPPGGPALPP